MKNEKTGAMTSSKEPRYGEGHVFLRWKDYDRRVLYVDILYVQASGSYSTYYLIDDSQIVTTNRLAVAERALPGDTFVRIHQSFILNWHYIDTFAGNSVKIGDNWFPVGRSYRGRLLAVLHFPEVLRGKHETES